MNSNPYLYTLIIKFNFIVAWTLATNFRPHFCTTLRTLEQTEYSSITYSTFWIFPQEHISFVRTARSGSCLTHPSYTCFQTHPPLAGTVLPSGTVVCPHTPSSAVSIHPLHPNCILLSPMITTATATAPPWTYVFRCPVFPQLQSEWRTCGSLISSLGPQSASTPQNPWPEVQQPEQAPGRTAQILSWKADRAAAHDPSLLPSLLFPITLPPWSPLRSHQAPVPASPHA